MTSDSYGQACGMALVRPWPWTGLAWQWLAPGLALVCGLAKAWRVILDRTRCLGLAQAYTGPKHRLGHRAKAQDYALASGPCSGFTQRPRKAQATATATGSGTGYGPRPKEPKRRPWPLVQAHALALAQSTGFGHGQRPKHARSSGTGRVHA